MFTRQGALERHGRRGAQGTTLLTRPDVIAKRPATVQKMVNAPGQGQQAHHVVVRRGDGQGRCPRSWPAIRSSTPSRSSTRREAFPPDSLVGREGVARVIETMRAFEAVAGRHEDRARERLRQPLRAEGPGALETRRTSNVADQGSHYTWPLAGCSSSELIEGSCQRRAIRMSPGYSVSSGNQEPTSGALHAWSATSITTRHTKVGSVRLRRRDSGRAPDSVVVARDVGVDLRQRPSPGAARIFSAAPDRQ